MIVTQPSSGTLSVLTGNKVTYTPATNFNGSDSFTYMANDGSSDSAAATVTLSVAAVNDAPVATVVTATTNEDAAVEVTLSATDADGDALTYVIVTQPSSGTLSAVTGNKVTYTPTADYNGSDSFTYKVNDGNSDSKTVTVTLNVAAANDAPVAQAATVATLKDIAVEVTLNATDPNNDTLSFKIVTQPTSGSLGTITGNKVTYTPDRNYTGSDSFSFSTNDGVSDSNVATVQLSVAPLKRGKIIDSPVANLPYKVGNYEGVTDSEGYFRYNYDGEEIYFNVGNIKLGSTEAKEVITTINVSKSSSALDPKNIELLRFLQTLDQDGDPSNGIFIDPEAHDYQAEDNIDFSVQNVSAVNVLTNLGWQSVEIVGEDAAVNHFLETLASSDDLHDYCEITKSYVGSIFKQDTDSCLQRKYRDTYFNLILQQITAEANIIANSIESTDASRALTRDTITLLLNSKKLIEFIKLIDFSKVSLKGQAAIKTELAEIMVEASIASFAGEEYASIWKNTLFSYAAAFKGDKDALVTITENSIETLYGAYIDLTHAWSLNELTEKANEVRITDYVLVHYFDSLTDQEVMMSSLGLIGDFNWTNVVETIASKNGYSDGVLSEDYNVDDVIEMVHGYIKLAEKVVGEDFTYTNNVSESEALNASGLYDTFLRNIANSIETGAIRNPVSEPELGEYAQLYYSDAYLAERIYTESLATEGGSRDLWTLWDYHCDVNGLVAGLYKREGKEEYTLSFGGTSAVCDKLDKDDLEVTSFVDTFTYSYASTTNALSGTVIDLAADAFLFSNFPLKSNQARSALEYIETEPLKYLLDTGKVTSITGHSLGGGLASYVGLYTGVNTTTFNTSPLPFTAESLSTFIDKGVLQNIVFSENGYVSDFKFVNEDKIVNLMAVKDPVSLISLELIALQEYANDYPEMFKWYLNPIKVLFSIPAEAQLDYLIQGKQVFLPVDYGSTLSQHFMGPLLGTFKQYNTDFDQDGIVDTLDDFPSDPLYYLDSDGDGLPNAWEEAHGLEPFNTDNSLGDEDADGLSNLAEYINKTNPEKNDTDGDQMLDGWEVTYSLDPLTDDAAIDSDGDGRSNLREFLDGTNARDPEDFFIVESSKNFSLVSQSTEPATVQLTWGAVDQAESYVLYYSKESTGCVSGEYLSSCTNLTEAQFMSDIIGTSATVTEGLIAGETYYFVMAAVRLGEIGLISEQLKVVLDSDSTIDLSVGLVAHYAFEENGNDSSDNQFDATGTNVSYIEGAKGKAAHLPSGNGLLIASYDWPELQNFTISMYVKLDEYASDATSQWPAGNVFLSFDHLVEGSGLENALELALEPEYSNELDKRYLSLDLTGERELYSQATSDGFLKQWTSLIYVREGDQFKVYVNGQLFHRYDAPSTVAFTPGNLVVGKNYLLLDQGLSLFGAMDELRIYDRAVSPTEIEELSKTTATAATGTGKLNDTGITQCSDASTNGLSCPLTDYPNQDAQYGRDFNNNDDSDGHAGFSFTKLDANGNALLANATDWSCVKDNVTGLIWEVKQGGNGTVGDEGLHDADDRYNWYTTDTSNDGGFASYEDNDGAICHGYNVGDATSYCNTQAYVERVNARSLCGASDWRLPERKALLSIVSYDRVNPSIDAEYFPNTKSSWYWSSSPYAYGSNNAWYVSFSHGNDGTDHKYSSPYVRLVRGGQ